MNILFLCTHNACRSILAEAIFRQLATEHQIVVRVASAGSAPRGTVHPLTLHYLALWSLDNRVLHSRSWNELTDFQPDLVITLCDEAADESCPVWFGSAVKGHWGLPDPSRAGLTTAQIDCEFNQLLNVLTKRCEALLTLQQPDSEAIAAIALAHPFEAEIEAEVEDMLTMNVGHNAE